jgi:hypothetical protein
VLLLLPQEIEIVVLIIMVMMYISLVGLVQQLLEMQRIRKKSPVVAIAKASFLSKQAAMKEATNFESLIVLQREDLSLRKDDTNEQMKERQLISDEKESNTLVLQKNINLLCPDDDPME